MNIDSIRAAYEKGSSVQTEQLNLLINLHALVMHNNAITTEQHRDLQNLVGLIFDSMVEVCDA